MATPLALAFLATFGHAAPVLRDTPGAPAGTAGIETIVMRLSPDRLVHLHGGIWALIIKESTQEQAHFLQGAIAVAYLQKSQEAWSLLHLWPEIAKSGSFGEPANGGEKIYSFGTSPLYVATGEHCGMDACSATLAAISLDTPGPHFLGTIYGGAAFPAEGDPLFDTCESYKFTATISPPTLAGAAFSVTYAGWRAPAGKLVPKTYFRYFENALPNSSGLRLSPKFPVPDCAR